MATPMIRIDGLKQFQRDLKKLDAALAKGLRKALNQAAELVAADARPLVPRRSGRAAATLKASSSQREARVKGGSPRAPYYPWLEFGGRVGRNDSVVRPRLKEGRYMFRALGSNRDVIQEVLEDSLIELTEGAGMDVRNG